MVTCDSCGIALGPDLVYRGDEPYCCTGCTAGGPCVCTYEQDLGRYPPAPYARPVSFAELLDRYEKGIQKRIEGPGIYASRQTNEDPT